MKVYLFTSSCLWYLFTSCTIIYLVLYSLTGTIQDIAGIASLWEHTIIYLFMSLKAHFFSIYVTELP